MSIKDAVEWHSTIAEEFDSKYKKSRTFKERLEVWLKVIKKYSKDDHRVLDIGCGSGAFSFYAASLNKEVFGIDASERMLDICNEKKLNSNLSNIEFKCCDLSDIEKLFLGTWNLIICSSVLEYTEKLDHNIKILSSLLEPGGVIAISMPNRLSLYRKLESKVFQLSGFPRYYRFVKNVVTKEEMVTKLTTHHLRILQTKYYASNLYLPNIPSVLKLEEYHCNLFVIIAQKT